MDPNLLAHVVDAARANPMIRRELREMTRLERMINAIADSETRKLNRLSTEALMRMAESGTGMGTESKERIAEISARKRSLAEHLASLIPVPSTIPHEFAGWLLEHQKELVTRLPRRKWWEIVLGRD